MPEPEEYLHRLPSMVPAGRVLVHNNVRPTRHLGMRGFRAWLTTPHPALTSCDCGWASELGEHFRPRPMIPITPIDPLDRSRGGGARPRDPARHHGSLATITRWRQASWRGAAPKNQPGGVYSALHVVRGGGHG
jgi:hypothetical protein